MEGSNIYGEQLVSKIKSNIEKIGTDIREFPASASGQYFDEKRETYLKLDHIFGWTQSFFTGMTYWAYVYSKDVNYIRWMNRLYPQYKQKVFDTPLETMHDLGFTYSLYAVALYKLTADKQMKELGVKAADELAKRYIPNGGYIRAWGRMDDVVPDYVDAQLAKDHFFTESQGIAIIDTMMNLPLLFWASEVTGHPYYKDIAMMHADMTLEYFIRPDGSVYHAYRFNPETGEPVGGDNYCGYNVDSYWARGLSWAIYGFAIAYGYTKEKRYLKAAKELANEFIEKSEGQMPLWDFRLPEEEKQKNKDEIIDTSAAAITCCAIYELLEIEPDPVLEKAVERYMNILEKDYVNHDEKVEGILRAQNGRGHYACYGDYFYVEAWMRKNKNYQSIW